MIAENEMELFKKFFQILPKSKSSLELEKSFKAFIDLFEVEVNRFVGYWEGPYRGINDQSLREINYQLSEGNFPDCLNFMAENFEIWEEVFREQEMSALAERARIAQAQFSVFEDFGLEEYLYLMSEMMPFLTKMDFAYVDKIKTLLVLLSLESKSGSEILSTYRQLVFELAVDGVVNVATLDTLHYDLNGKFSRESLSLLRLFMQPEHHSHGASFAIGNLQSEVYADFKERSLEPIRVTKCSCVLDLSLGLWQCVGSLDDYSLVIHPDSPEPLIEKSFIFKEYHAYSYEGEFKFVESLLNLYQSHLARQFRLAALIMKIRSDLSVRFGFFENQISELHVLVSEEGFKLPLGLIGIEVINAKKEVMLVLGPANHRIVRTYSGNYSLVGPFFRLEGLDIDEANDIIDSLKTDALIAENEEEFHQQYFNSLRLDSERLQFINRLVRMSEILDAWNALRDAEEELKVFAFLDGPESVGFKLTFSQEFYQATMILQFDSEPKIFGERISELQDKFLKALFQAMCNPNLL